jgi:dTDP-4-dehydrorhamnose 3,5-epimerase
MLSDIKVTPLKRISTSGGDVLHAMKKGDQGFGGFGEAYFSWVSSGAVKAWKRHTKMEMNLVVPVGNVRFVFFSHGLNSEEEFRTEDIGEDRYVRITVPPAVWFGFQGVGWKDSLVLNIANIPHDPSEVERLSLSEVDYKWG